MAEPLSSIDPTKKLYSTVPPAPAPKSTPKKPAVDLEYVPAGPKAASYVPIQTSSVSTDPSSWPDDVLERNYTALRIRIGQQPKTVTDADRALLAKMEAELEKRQGTDKEPEKPKGAIAMLASSGVKLAEGAAKAHMTTAETRKYVAEYTAYVEARKSDPKFAALHADAVVAGPKLIAAAEARDREKDLAVLRFEVNEKVEHGAIKSIQLPVPLGVQQLAIVEPVATATAEAIDFAIQLVPVAGQFWAAYEIAIGKHLGGLGTDMTTSEQVLGGALLLAPYLGKILKGGPKVILEIAKRTGKTPEEVLMMVEKASQLGPKAKTALKGLENIKFGKPLTAEQHAALDEAEKLLGIKIDRTYKPTITPRSDFVPGYGETDKYGNIHYSSLGTKTDQALALQHEKVHSFLAPKTLNGLRELRCNVGMLGYEKSSVLRYVEEAAAEGYANIKVKGLNPQSILKGATFPLKEGYVRLVPGMVEVGDKTVFNLGLAAEVTLGTIVVGGTVYTVQYVENKAIDAVEDAVNAEKAKGKK